MRLHNRQVKAAFWDDPDLLRMPRDARFLFEGLWALADDSGCVYDDPFIFKTKLFPSPMDADLTVEKLAEYRDMLVATGMLIPYTANGKRCLYIKNFHEHQSIRHPAAPEVPLPPWVQWEASEQSRRSGQYYVSPPTATVVSQYSDDTDTQQPPTLNPKPITQEPIDPPHNPPQGNGPGGPPYAEIIGYLNERTGKNFRAGSDNTKRHIKARWREGYTLDDFRTVIDKKAAQWMGTDMEPYLRPQTLFSAKFEAYLNEPWPNGRRTHGEARDPPARLSRYARMFAEKADQMEQMERGATHGKGA